MSKHAINNIYDYLKYDHDEIKSLADEILTCKDEDEQKKLFLIMREKILTHSKAEEKVFYRPLEQIEETQDEMDHSEYEHREIEKYLSLLTALPQGDKWLSEMKELKHVIIHHINHEENKIFPKAKKIFTDEEAKQMISNIEHQKVRIKKFTSKADSFSDKWDKIWGKTKQFFSDMKETVVGEKKPEKAGKKT